MPKINNSQNYYTINRKALTFAADVSSRTVNTNLEVISDPVTTADIDLSNLETEQSASEKLAFAWKLITELACKIESLIADKTYSVVAHADNVYDEIPIPTGTAVTIPYHDLRFTPTDGTFVDGVFTAGKSGYYDVDCYYYDTKITPPMLATLGISSTADGACEGDTTLVGSGRFKLQASRKVYLPAGGSVSAVLSHSLGTTQTFNYGTGDEAGYGYISISYCGGITAANNTY